MKKLLLSMVSSAMITIAFCQADLKVPAKRCGSFEVYKQMLQSDAAFAKNQQAIENFTKNFIAKNAAATRKTAAGTPVYTIPVVVHVIYKTTAQNISDAQIQSQIDVLNKDYQKLNADASKTPSVWTGLVADCKIQFCLAKIDPLGNATTGIRRVQTTKNSFSYISNGVKYTNKGGDNAWPAASYLNLWVCKISGGVLGYAQFPGGNAATDGVVIAYDAFGTTGSAAAPYNLGRTATHEIGHWMNLRHIWGDDGSGCNGSDQVDDTPNQGKEHYGCPKFPFVTCSNGPNGDMFMNYMDYTDDRCMFMFTNGQKDRMYATLVAGGARNSVTVSGKCGASKNISSSTNAAIILSVVPNPVRSGSATLNFRLEKAAQVQVVISNIYGNIVSAVNAGNLLQGEHKLQLSEMARLNNGTYNVKLIANGKEISTTRFVVNK